MVISCKISEELKEDILGLLSGTETVSQFVHKAAEEKVRRMKVRNETAKQELHKKNIEALEPIIMQVLHQHGIC